MRKDALWALGLGVAVIACFDKADDDDEDEDEDEDDGDGGSGVGGGVGGGSGSGSGSGGGDSLTSLAEAVCGAYDDCGLLEEYYENYSDCVNSALSNWDSYECSAGSSINECISAFESQGCDYLYGYGSGECYYALDCAG